LINPKDDRLGRALSCFLDRQSSGTVTLDCPNEETLAGYLWGSIEGEARDELESHFSRCALCLENLSVAFQTGEERGSDLVPPSFLKKAMALVPPKEGMPNFLEIAVRLFRGTLELVSTSGELVQAAAPVAIRGRLKSSDNPILQVDKELENFHVSVDLERLEGDLCQVAVTVKPKDGSVADAIRMSLVSGGREQASYLARQGTAIFERIEPGDYRLEVFDSGHSAGSIRLTIKESCHE
jgi:hypothetical protein